MAEYKIADPNDFPEEFKKIEPINLSVGVDPEEFASFKPRPDLEGKRVRHPQGMIFLVLDGLRRGITNPTAYNNLFRDWNGVITDINVLEITDGGNLSDNAFLATQSEGNGAVFLISNNVKRGITSPAAMDKYYFAWERIVRIPREALNSIPDGRLISA